MAPVLAFTTARDLSVAVLAGLAVGIERERSGHATGPAARFAGTRTFLLLGLVGGVAGWLATVATVVLGAVILAGGVALTVAAYVTASRQGREEIGATTEVAALAVLALGVVAGLGFPLLTSAATSIMVLALIEKSRIHTLVERIGEVELSAALKFAVLALVILPLLPPGPFGPHDSIRPRGLWIIVLLLSGLNFIGYVARRALGPAWGSGLTGLLGGLVSSTAVTLSFGAQSRRQPTLGRALARGAIAANAVAIPRALVVMAGLHSAVASDALRYLLLPLVAGGGIVAWVIGRRPGKGPAPDESEEDRSPLRLASAVRMAVLFQLVLIALPEARRLWGASGVLSSAVIVGLTDLDALAVSMAQLARTGGEVELAALGFALGVVASTFFKTGVALLVGTGEFRRRTGSALLALALVAAAGFWLGWR
jgi:uncharacterized membrane protein (DUF4010 family)